MKLDLLRDASRSFPDVEDYESITAMRVWHCKYKTIEAIGRFSNLTELVIATVPDDSLEFLSSLKKLRYLWVMHLPKIRDVSPLSNIASLESVSLTTLVSWGASRKISEIETLEPFSKLPKLKDIELLNVVPVDKSLLALEGVDTLESAGFSGYPKKVISRFYAVSGVKSDSFPCSVFSR